ncbi:sensor histidine kinase [Salirhabdus salicampi]|uniref:sensor histidine kinase n=1 Tax=Salirhabdus salicampi TaxID=476102 RepID=UPI0020C290A7|nr:histidine kinase [Salirhabdus salicampi]MCP8615895.1 histidine kinase [Salirhabdus salicampi]
MFLTQQMFSALIIIAVFVPIIGSIVLFMNMAYEREFRLLTVEKQKAELEKEFEHSQYMQLNAQIHPHFLFNTINLILGLARLDKKKLMIQTLESLSNLLKFKYQVKEYLIPFQKELNYTVYYLTIQQNRFGEFLTIQKDIKDDVLDALVPPYILQTVTENAFKHGLEKKVGKKILSIHCYRDEDIVIIEVSDNGTGLDSTPQQTDSGHGLENIQKRLELLFNREQVNVNLEPLKEGTRVTIQFPYHTEETSEGVSVYEHITRR